MQEKEIIKYLKDNIEPIQDNVYGIGYRASIYLLDGTFIPCVVFRNSKKIVDLAIRRFHEEQKVKGIFNKSGYRDIVKSFVTKNNCVVSHDIQRIEKSRFAIPYSIMKQIYGETYMSWTGFVVKMKNGKCFNFGTAFDMEFFNIPEEYSVEDIEEIINHSYILKTGEIKSYHNITGMPDKEKIEFFYRERPYFNCYLDDL